MTYEGTTAAQRGEARRALDAARRRARGCPSCRWAASRRGSPTPTSSSARRPKPRSATPRRLRSRRATRQDARSWPSYLADRGERDAAIEQLREAVRLDPETAGAAGELAELLLAAGRGDEAARTLSELLVRRPLSADIRLSYGVVLAHLDRIDESLAEIDKVTARTAGIRRCLSQARADPGRPLEVRGSAGRGESRRRDRARPRYRRTCWPPSLRRGLGQNDVARQHLDAALRSAPFNAQLVAVWARLVTRMGDLDRMLAAAEAAPPTNLAARLQLLYLYREAGRAEDASGSRRSSKPAACRQSR